MSQTLNIGKISVVVISTIISISVFNSVHADESPEPCSPYPMCKLFDENEKVMTDPLRLNEPSELDVETIKKQVKEDDKQAEELIKK